MKKILFILVVLVATLVSCDSNPGSVNVTKAENKFHISGVPDSSGDDPEFVVVTIDSCEYLIGKSWYRGYMAHKGNCKYCEQRRKFNKK